MFGLMFGLTPTVGAQMALLTLLWLTLGRLPLLRFNLVLAVAWSWVSNPFDFIPLYYIFHITGQAMLGRLGDGGGFEQFSQLIGAIDLESAGGLENITAFFHTLFDLFGVSILIGWIPHSVVFSIIGYWGTLWFIKRYRAQRLARRARRLAAVRAS